MEVIRIDSKNNDFKIETDVVYTIGDFDGVHIAHQTLFRKALELAGDKGYKSGVITFDPHPNMIIKKNNNNTTILSLQDRIKKIEEFNFDYLIIIQFDVNLMNLDHENFVKKILLNLGVKLLVIGFDFKYGKNGLGNKTTVLKDSNNLIELFVVEELSLNGRKIGSSLVKELLKEGKIEDVNKILGYNYFVEGKVVHGRNIGEKLKVPTANLDLNINYPPIKEGVYVVKCYLNNKCYKGICNIGHNPSFNYQNNISYEVHIINEDFNQNIYDQFLKIEFVRYIRDEVKFASKDEFKKQIEKDKKLALMTLNNAL